MGQRATSETLVAIIVAFWKERSWTQAELARRVGVSPRALRKHLDDLTLAGWPLVRDEEHPHVYWSVPKGWFPGGVLLEGEKIGALIRLLLHVPPTRERTRLLEAVMGHAPPQIADALARVVPPRASEAEERVVPSLLDAVAGLHPLRIDYFTASRGELTTRVVSIQRVLLGPPARFLAHCHSANALRVFRVDCTSNVSRQPESGFVAVDDRMVDEMLEASIDGFHSGTLIRVAFFVRQPEARWVARNLPDGLRGTSEKEGLLVEADTAGLLPIARFVVGLGEAAECRTPELAALVRELAEGALRVLRTGEAQG